MKTNKCIHCKERREDNMYNEYICKECRKKWEKNPYLTRGKYDRQNEISNTKNTNKEK